MANERAGRQLANLLVEKRLQLRHVGVVTVFSAAICALLGYLIWLQRDHANEAILRILNSVDYLDAEGKLGVMQHLEGKDSSLLLMMAGVCVGLIAVISLFLVILTHRIAGPVHHIARSIDILRAGRLPRVHAPRQSDEMKKFINKFKHMTDTLRVRAEDDLAAYEAFLAACAAAGVEPESRLGVAVGKLRARRDALETALAD